MKTLEDLVSGVKKGLKRLAYAGVVLGALAVGAGEAKAEFVRGNLFVTSYDRQGILELDNLGNEIRSIDDRPGILYLAQNLTFGPDGNLYVLRRDNDISEHSIYIYNSSGVLLDKKSDFTSAPSSGLAFSPVNNHLYLVQGPGRIIELDENLNFLKVIADDINSSYDLAIDSKGNIYVPDLRNDHIRKYNLEGKLITAFGNIESPVGIEIGPNGNVFVSDVHTRTSPVRTFIHEYDIDTLELVRTIADEHIGGSSAYITFDLEDNIYVTTTDGIGAYDWDGNYRRKINILFPKGIKVYIPEPVGISLLALSSVALLKRKSKK